MPPPVVQPITSSCTTRSGTFYNFALCSHSCLPFVFNLPVFYLSQRRTSSEKSHTIAYTSFPQNWDLPLMPHIVSELPNLDSYQLQDSHLQVHYSTAFGLCLKVIILYYFVNNADESFQLQVRVAHPHESKVTTRLMSDLLNIFIWLTFSLPMNGPSRLKLRTSTFVKLSTRPTWNYCIQLGFYWQCQYWRR